MQWNCLIAGSAQIALSLKAGKGKIFLGILSFYFVEKSCLRKVRLDKRANKLLHLKIPWVELYKGINKFSNQLNLKPCHSFLPCSFTLWSMWLSKTLFKCCRFFSPQTFLQWYLAVLVASTDITMYLHIKMHKKMQNTSRFLKHKLNQFILKNITTIKKKLSYGILHTHKNLTTYFFAAKIQN